MTSNVKGRKVTATTHFTDRVKLRFKADAEFAEAFATAVAQAILLPTDEVYVRKDTYRSTAPGANRYTIICPHTGSLIVVIASVKQNEITLITAYAPKAKSKPHLRPARLEDYMRLFGKAPQHMIDERMAS